MLLLKAEEIRLPQRRKLNKWKHQTRRVSAMYIIHFGELPPFETSPCWIVNLPGKQSHLNPLDRPTHTEPCWHRPSTQWFRSVVQCIPVYPCWHTHLCVFASSSQKRVPLGSQGFDKHWSTDEEQSLPWYPVRSRIKEVIDGLCCLQCPPVFPCLADIMDCNFT